MPTPTAPARRDKSGRLFAETSDGGQTFTGYIWLNDTLVALLQSASPTDTRYYVHPDHLNTPRVLSDQNQQIRWRWDNDDPFGGNMANANPGGLGAFSFNLRYPGQYFDAETNNHYNTFRDYSPEIGRYIESDPIGLRGGLNTYTYVGGNPISYSDPLGLVDPYKHVPRPPAGPTCDGTWEPLDELPAPPPFTTFFCKCRWVC